jgi:DNA-binding CsgD family transcriptional regulator
MSKIDPFIWHNRQQWGEPTEQQLKFMLDSFQFNMGVGVSLPVRFNQFGVGGIGLNFADSTEKEFNKIWASYRDEISTIGFVYDELARGNHMQEICPLSPREIEVLTWLTLGKNIKMIAHKIGNSTSTVDKQIRSARRKLNARNNEQAVVKALILGLIEP